MTVHLIRNVKLNPIVILCIDSNNTIVKYINSIRQYKFLLHIYY